jgi:hypothetical protein
MKIILKTAIVITIIVFLSACSSLSSLPEIESGQEPEETDSSLGNDPGEGDEQNEEFVLDSNPPREACQQENILIYVTWDHIWTWSPDGTEATGGLKGQAAGHCPLILSPDGNGDMEVDTCSFKYTQSGIIQGDKGQCKVDGEGWVDLFLSGTCQDGIMVLEWMEVGNELQETNMICDGKSSEFVGFYPAQAIFGVEVPEHGWAYQTSDGTIMPLFRGVSMEWDVRLVPAGQSY